MLKRNLKTKKVDLYEYYLLHLDNYMEYIQINIMHENMSFLQFL